MVRVVDLATPATYRRSRVREWPRTPQSVPVPDLIAGQNVHLHSSQLQDRLSKRVHPNNNRLSRASGALVDQILRRILILDVVHPEINFNLLSRLESGKAWIHG